MMSGRRGPTKGRGRERHGRRHREEEEEEGTMDQHERFPEDDEDEDENEDGINDEEEAGGDQEEDGEDEEASSTGAMQDLQAKMKEELASVPFEVLQALKKRGDAKAPFSRYGASAEKSADKKDGKQAKKGKNQPMEVSSKQRPPRFIDFGTIPKKTQRNFRDPRFDSLSGKFNEELFNKSYSFVREYKQDEIRELNEQLKKEKDPEEQERIRLGIRILQNQLDSAKREEEHKQKTRERKKLERELVLQGKRPFYSKKSDVKELELLQKFSELKQQGKLDKYLVKKKRRNAAKEHKRIPWRRRTAGDADA